jgi:hypothetical protein
MIAVFFYHFGVSGIPDFNFQCCESHRVLLWPSDAGGSFASQHRIVSPRIQRVAAADALEGQPVTPQEAVLLNGFVCVMEARWLALLEM